MKLEYSKQRDHLMILLDGRLDANNAQQLEKALDEAINIGEHHLVLNMSNITYLSSGGMRLLIKFQQALKKINGTLTISSPTPIVQNVLGLAGMLNIFMPSNRTPVENPVVEDAQHHVIKNVSFTIYRNSTPGEMQCFLRGYPELMRNGSILDYPSDNLKCREDFHAIGLGILGNNLVDLKSRCGEFITVSGMAAHQPGDNSPLPDYMYNIGDFQPSVQSAYSIEMHGGFAYCLRFETHEENINFSSLLQILHQQLKSEYLGIVMLAHCSGLVGASLGGLPESGKNVFFSYPEIRDRLFYTSEPIGAQKMALTAGISLCQENGRCQPFVRPIGHDIYGHFHAAIFDRRLFPHGKLELHRTVYNLINEQSPFKVLHLINDDRELIGAGESKFIQGVIWVSPLNSIIRKHTNGVVGGK